MLLGGGGGGGGGSSGGGGSGEGSGRGLQDEGNYTTWLCCRWSPTLFTTDPVKWGMRVVHTAAPIKLPKPSSSSQPSGRDSRKMRPAVTFTLFASRAACNTTPAHRPDTQSRPREHSNAQLQRKGGRDRIPTLRIVSTTHPVFSSRAPLALVRHAPTLPQPGAHAQPYLALRGTPCAPVKLVE